MKVENETKLAAVDHQKTRPPKLVDEVDSWKLFAKALRLEDRKLFQEMIEKIWSYTDAVENSGEEKVTEAFLLSLLISQQKIIDKLLEKRRRYSRDDVLSSSKDFC